MLAITYQTYGPPEVLSLEEVPTPVPGKKDILVKVHCAAVTKGDCEMRSPEIFSTVWFIVRLAFGIRKPRINILGSYFSGEVVGAGTEVSRFRTGDRVFGINGAMFRCYAEYLRTPEKAVVCHLPNNVTFEDAAPVALGIDSLHFIMKLRLKKGESLLINGAGGGIGTYAVQLAKMEGVHVTAVDSADKESMLRDYGADDFIDYTSHPPEKWTSAYDAIFDVVGSIKYRQSKRLLRNKGRYVSAIPEVDRMFLSMLGSLFTSKKVMTGLTAPTVADLEHLASLMAEGKLKTAIYRTYGMEDIVQAHKDIEADLKSGNSILCMIKP